MSDRDATPARRTNIERGIYKRQDGKYEIGYRDGAGRQRWQTVEGGITAARAMRTDLLARKARGERVAANPRLRFAEAADQWLATQVAGLTPSTQAAYRWALDKHLRPEYATRRLDAITPDDLVVLFRKLDGKGLSASSRRKVLNVLNGVYRHARRRQGYAGPIPGDELLRTERPSSTAPTRRFFEGAELEQTISAAGEPWRTLFVLTAATGARIGEALGLTWGTVDVDDPDAASVTFAHQLGRSGELAPLKTEGSRRTVPILRGLAVVLAAHRENASDTSPGALVFVTGTGRALCHRNVTRALRAAQKAARTPEDEPTFPLLHEKDENEKAVPVPSGSLPSMHGFRHTFASRALAAGESVDEVAFMLGHENANVTRAVYTHEIADTRRQAMRRSRIATEYAAALEAAGSEHIEPVALAA